MRLASLNLLHGLAPADGRVDGARLQEAVASLDADVLCLQEVDRGQERSGGLDLTALCAEALGARWSRFAPALAGTPGHGATAAGDEPVVGPAYGNAIVSRLPVRGWHTHRLAPPRFPMPMPGLIPKVGPRGVRLAPPQLIRDEPRVVLAAELDHLTVGCAHLTFVQGPNVGQLRAATGFLRTLPGPRVLLGDLNMLAPLPHLVTGWRPLVAGRTFPSWRPRLQIDHALADGAVAVLTARVVPLPVSDHCALVVDLPD